MKTLPENNLAQNAIESFKHNIQIETDQYNKISEFCKELIKKFPFWSSKLSQVSYRLEIVKGILQEIRNPIISSRLFSLLVRGLIFWEHSAFEGLLQALYGIKTGIDAYSHDLPFLYQKSIQSEKQRKDLLFLNRDLNNMHNLVRYPFSPGNGSESKRNLILQAELFRECPELGMEQQFELQCDKKSLNYLKVKREDTPAEIIKKLNETSKKIIKIINKRMIPEFNSAV